MTNTQSNMSFKVNPDAITLNLIGGEVRALMATRNNPEKRKEYIDIGVVNPTINEFMRRHPKVFGSKKFIHADGSNFFEEIMPIVSETTESQVDTIKNRMRIQCDLTDSQLSEMDTFIEDLYSLKNEPVIQKMITATESYKNSIEKAWKSNESSIVRHIHKILGYVPEKNGRVETFVVYPNVNTHRTYQSSDNTTALFFGKSGEKDIKKILAHLAHQRVHQPMLPYKKSMTKADKEKFHAFIKFLTDKEIYHEISNNSSLEIVTPKENPELMGKIYPFWLGYRYRNAKKDGLKPEIEIRRRIKQDKEYFDGLPKDSRKRKLYAYYNFDSLSPEKIAAFFREKKGITPYEFAEIDFDDKSLVYKDEALKSKNSQLPEYR